MNILQRHIQCAIWQTFFSRLWFRQIQDLKDLVTCCHSIHCDMEKGTEQTKRQEKLAGKQDDAKRSAY